MPWQEHRLGDLDLQPFSRDARCFQGAPDVRGQTLAHDMRRRHIDGDLDVAGHFRQIRAGFRQYPGAERDHQSGLLGDGNELIGRDRSAPRMAPAQQRFAAHDLAAADVDDRLIVQCEVPIRQRLAQIELQFAPRLHRGLHGRLEETISAAARRFGAIESEVGALEHLIGVIGVRRRQSEPDAAVEDDAMTVEIDRRADGVADALRQGGGVGRARCSAREESRTSSPPSLATTSASRMQARRRFATAFSTSSPTACLSVSVHGLETVEVKP